MLSVAAAFLALAPQGLWVATAKVDITPNEPLPLGGYTERGGKLSIPGGDSLYARAVMFEVGSKKIAIVSIDSLTTPESLAREVRKRIPQDVFLFLAATHTHSAPDSQMLNDHMTFSIPGIASYRPKLLEWYADKIASCVTSAQNDPERTGFLDVYVSEAHSDFNIARRKFANPDQMVTRVEGGDRDRLGPMEGGRIRTTPYPIFVSYAAHGTVYGAKELQLRGDWPGVAAEKFSAPILQGAIGDVLPKEWGKTSAESVQRIVDGLSSALDHARRHRVWKSGGPIATAVQPIELGDVQPHPTMAKTYGVPESFAAGIVKQFAPTETRITAFRIGKLAVVGVPGEPTSFLGRRIRDAGRRIGFESVLVCSHVNGWMGYILDPEDYDRGGYEATLSFYGREEGDRVVEAGISALQRLAKTR